MTSPVVQFLSQDNWVAAGSTPTIRGILKDGSDPPQAVGSGSVSALTLSITDDNTGAVVNDCDKVDILNTGRGTLDADGNLAITLTAEDTAMLRANDARENRSLTVDFEYPGPGAVTGVGRGRLIFVVVKMPGN